MFLRPSSFERHVMSKIDELQAAVADANQALADTATKVDTLIAQNDALIGLTDSISRQLVALGEAGQIPADALSSLITSIDSAKTAALAIGAKADAETAKVQAAIAADTPPAPSPAPAPDAPAGDVAAAAGEQTST